MPILLSSVPSDSSALSTLASTLATSFVQLSLTSARNEESTPLSPSSLTCCCLAAGGGGCYSHLERRSDLKGPLGRDQPFSVTTSHPNVK